MISVTSKSIQRARRVALRQRSTNACTPCKQAKTKCVNYRPCSRCAKRSQEIVCSDDLKIINCLPALTSCSDLVKQKRSFKSKQIMSINFNSEKHSFLVSPAHPAVNNGTGFSTLPISRPGICLFIPVDRLARYWSQAGFRMEEVQAVLKCLPDPLRAVLDEGLAKLCGLNGFHPTHSVGPIVPLSTDMGEDFWASVEYCGYIRHTYEPGTMRSISTFANHAYARLAGLPDPAAVIRSIEAHSLPIANQTDWLCCMLDDLTCAPLGSDFDVTRLVRLPVDFAHPGPPTAHLVTVTTQSRYDARGNLREIRRLITPASNEEYDYALSASPELCRPFAAAMGDLRAAGACLAGYAADCAAGLAGLTPSASARLVAAARARLAAAEAEVAAGGWRLDRLQCGSPS